MTKCGFSSPPDSFPDEQSENSKRDNAEQSHKKRWNRNHNPPFSASVWFFHRYIFMSGNCALVMDQCHNLFLLIFSQIIKCIILPQVGDMYTAYIVLNKFVIFDNKNLLFKLLLQFSIIQSISTFFLKLQLLQTIFAISFPCWIPLASSHTRNLFNAIWFVLRLHHQGLDQRTLGAPFWFSWFSMHSSRSLFINLY